LSAFSFPNFRFSSVAGGADPGRGAERLTERLLSWQTRTLGNGSRGAAETRRKSNLPPSALSAPPREKKFRFSSLANVFFTVPVPSGMVLPVQLPDFRFSSFLFP
jgi:hypothetical protein